MVDATVRLFWFKGGPDRQYLVRATSKEDAEQEMSQHGLAYQESGQVEGAEDELPAGEWTLVNDKGRG